METLSSRIINALGGTTAVARMVCAPVSTVHSWRTIGIPASRLAHLKLAAQVEDLEIDWDNPQPQASAA